MVTVKCAECGKPFETWPRTLRRVKSPTCSRQCNGRARGRAWGTIGHTGPKAKTPAHYASAAAKLRGEQNPSWKGGVTLKRVHGNYQGVTYTRCPTEFLSMARADGYVMTHRLVMARWIGRPLTRTEVVHHRDHDPSHNDRSNLELWPTNADHKRAEFGRLVGCVANRR